MHSGRRPRTRLVVWATVSGLLAVLLAFSAAGPAASQESDRPAEVAPAIGPWLGAPRGSISGVIAVDGGVAIEGSVIDADSARATRYAVTVDGIRRAEGRTERPAGFGERTSLSTELSMSDGMHDVCLLLGDARFDLRTVDCVRATTAPPDTVSRAAARKATGVLVTPTGVVVPVTGGSAGAWEVISPCGTEATIADGEFVERARVVVDPGHGGSETGAVGGGILEKNLNLEVSEELVAQLNSIGITAQLTRTADYRLPIMTRAQIANALAPDVFISVHHNGGATRPSSRPGTEVFYATGQSEGQRLAAILYEEMVDTLSGYSASWVSTVSEGASLRLRDDRMDLYGIHRFSPDITSVISEYVYLSNPSEAALMNRPEMPAVEASTIVDSLLRWWWTEDEGTTRGREFVDSSSSGTGGFDGCTDPALVPDRSLAAERRLMRDDVLTDHAEGLSGAVRPVTPSVSLLPALQLGSDPAL